MKKLLGGVLVLGVLVVGLLALNAFKGRETETALTAPKGPPPSPRPDNLIRPATDPRSGGVHLEFRIVVGGDGVTVYQGDERDIEMPVIRYAEYVSASSSLGNVGEFPRIVLAGKFQGGVKLSSEIVQGGKGLTVKFDPETVKGSDDNSKLRIKADAEADLGEVQVKLTATTSEGQTASASLTLNVYKKR